MTSSMLAPANTAASDSATANVAESSRGSTKASASSSAASASAAHVIEAETAATNLVAKAPVANTTNECTGLVSSQDYRSSTVHPQPPFRSHVLLSNNSELSIATSATGQNQDSSMTMQQAAATDYFRPYLHTTPYSPGGGAVPPTGHMTPMAAHPHFPYHPAHHPRILSHDRDSQAALAAAAAVNAAAAAAAANNNSPTYKGYQNFYNSGNNNQVEALEVRVNNNNPTTTPTSTGNTSSDPQQYNSGNRIYPARPQPTRPVMPTVAGAGGSPPHTPIKEEPALTPPPSVMTHHRSQTKSSSTPTPAAAAAVGGVAANNSATNNNSAASYRDKLGLNSPSNHSTSTTPPTIMTPMSPSHTAENGAAANSSRRPSGNNNSKFRYPSGPSSSSSPPPPATPSSAMSSREGTPLPASQRPEDAAPNVDISRVQIGENNDKVIKREQASSSDHVMQSNTTTAPVAAATAPPPPTPQQQQQQQQFGYQFSPPSTSGLTPPTTSPPSTFSAQYSSYLAQPQQQPQHHMGWQQQQQHYYPLDGTNNNLMARGLQEAATLPGSPAHHLGGSMGAYGNYDPHQYQYGTIHHYGDPNSAQHSVLGSVSSVVAAAAAAASSSSGASVSAGPGSAAGGRGRGHHHSGSGSVKIGRRPAHLPKVLKFQDKSLPPGWVRKLKCRKHGKQAGRWDVYIYSPCGVKFASKKKLKAFFEKNNLNYDIEEFDFTPYGRHTDSGSRPSGSSGSSAGVRHNSSGSTGSEGTHAGSSPASLHNYSPTHHHALQSSSSTYMPQSMLPSSGSAASRLYSAALGPTASGPEFSSFTAFDPLMENPPNASVQDVPASTAASSSTEFIATSLAVAASNLGTHGGGPPTTCFKSDTSEFFPAEMAEILGSSPASTSLTASNGLTGSAFGPPLSLMASSDSYSDLTQTSSLHHAAAGGLQPLSNASMESKSTEDDADETSGSRSGAGDTKVSGFTEAIRARLDFGGVGYFE